MTQTQTKWNLPPLAKPQKAPSATDLLSQILASPNLQTKTLYRKEFWTAIFKEWFFPEPYQFRLENPVRWSLHALFSPDYPPPELPHGALKFGAYPNDVLSVIEKAKAYGVDLLVELARQGEYSAVRWVVRRVLRPDFNGARHLELGGRGGDVLGAYNPHLQEKVLSKWGLFEQHQAERPMVNRAGDVGLRDISKRARSSHDTHLLHQIQTARRGFGVVLESVGKMIVEASPQSLLSVVEGARNSALNVPRLSQYESLLAPVRRVSAPEDSDYCRLLPMAKEILAHLHNSGLMPPKLYDPIAHPRLSILQSRILTVLADASWRHHEDNMIKIRRMQAQSNGTPESAAEELRSELRLHGWWRGGFETSKDRPDLTLFKSFSRQEKRAQLMHDLSVLREMTDRGEREVLLEVVLRACILTGYGIAGTDILKKVEAQGGWNFVNYQKELSEDYEKENISFREEAENTNGIPGKYGVRGYAVVPPPIRTLSKTLPDDIISGVAGALVDSVAEGLGSATMISYLNTLGGLFDGSRSELTNSALISRVITMCEQDLASHAQKVSMGEELLSFIRCWSKPNDPILRGTVQAELNVWYRVLETYIRVENVAGTIRLWEQLQERMEHLMPENTEPLHLDDANSDMKAALQKRSATHYFHPPWVLGPFMMLLSRSHKYDLALSLLIPQKSSPFPIIPKEYYHIEQITPALLHLAANIKSLELADDIVATLPLKTPGAVSHKVLTSLVNTYLRLGELSDVQEIMDFMQTRGIKTDGVTMAVIIKNSLRKNKQEAYSLVDEMENETAPSIKRTTSPGPIASTWSGNPVPANAAARGRKQLLQSSPHITMSPSAWISVLSTAVDDNDRERIKQALTGLGVDIRQPGTLSTKIFNILLKGVVKRDGALKGWEMIQQHCAREHRGSDGKLHNEMTPELVSGTPNRIREQHWLEGGKGKWGTSADLVTFRTVLDATKKEFDDLRVATMNNWQVMRARRGLLKDIKEPEERQQQLEADMKAFRKRAEELGRKKEVLEELVALCRERLQAGSGL